MGDNGNCVGDNGKCVISMILNSYITVFIAMQTNKVRIFFNVISSKQPDAKCSVCMLTPAHFWWHQYFSTASLDPLLLFGARVGGN